MRDRWAFALLGWLMLAALVAMVGFAVVYQAVGANAGKLEGTAARVITTGAIVQSIVTFASLAYSGFLWITRVPPSGILWWHRLRTHRLSVSARLAVSFQPDSLPSDEDLERRLREWNGSGTFEVISSQPDSPGRPLRVDVHTQRIGRVVVSALHESAQPLLKADEVLGVVLALPDSPQELGHLVALLAGDIEKLIHALARDLGEATGIKLDVHLDARTNPFYGVYMRDDISRTGVTAFNVHLRPAPASEIEIGQTAISIRSTSRPEFQHVAAMFLGLRPIHS